MMIPPVLVGVGSNLPFPPYMSPHAVCEAAIDALAAAGLTILNRSFWFESAPVPASDQPWFINGVVSLSSLPDPAVLLAILHRIEARFSRVRGTLNAARTLDLDLLAFGDRVMNRNGGPILPHPRLHERAFVLMPLAQVAPGWRHPSLGRTVEEMITDLSPEQYVRMLGPEPG
jgi:2-amino-4-hydroxy-6-hydroxymethyldihydropteridine diphosphokinase